MHILRRWISGEADAHDEQALRAQAGDDPFLRDAVEGLEAFPEGDHAQRVTRLKGRIRQRSSRRALGPVWLIRRMAAAAVVVGLAGWGIWWMARQPGAGLSDKSIAIQETAPPAEQTSQENAAVEEAPSTPMPTHSPTPHTAPDPALQRSEDTARPSAARTEEEASSTLPAIAAERPKTDDLATAKPPASTQPAEVAVMPQAEPLTTNTPASTGQAAERSAANSISPAAPATTAKPASRTLKGKVTDASGEPLIGAGVLLQGTNTGTVTDLDGSYVLNVPAGISDPKLAVSYTGYETVIATPGASDRMNIVVPEGHSALSEVVVVGGSGKKSSRTSATQAGASVQPLGGFAALEAYIQKNKRLPAHTPLHAEVELEFSVGAQGNLRHFRVIRSPGPAYNEEAVRLLQSGPKWENRSGKEQKTRYVISF